MGSTGTQIQTAITSEYDWLPYSSCESCSMLTVTAPDQINGRSRTAVSVSLVLDASNSMRGHKWEVTKRAVSCAIDNLNQEDEFSIITYSAQVRAYLQLQACVCMTTFFNTTWLFHHEREASVPNSSCFQVVGKSNADVQHCYIHLRFAHLTKIRIRQ
jgi:hypothetical protein